MRQIKNDERSARSRHRREVGLLGVSQTVSVGTKRTRSKRASCKAARYRPEAEFRFRVSIFGRFRIAFP